MAGVWKFNHTKYAPTAPANTILRRNLDVRIRRAKLIDKSGLTPNLPNDHSYDLSLPSRASLSVSYRYPAILQAAPQAISSSTPCPPVSNNANLPIFLPALAVKGTSDLASAFPASINATVTWDFGLIEARWKAMGSKHKGKGINVALEPMTNLSESSLSIRASLGLTYTFNGARLACLVSFFPSFLSQPQAATGKVSAPAPSSLAPPSSPL
ncbi:hypothetical protein C8R44DRAFT_886903 [Mycena epipterygia]|nr:hypothetical protein C8R44DRAFT_886903 [Mycena epipterygia]